MPGFKRPRRPGHRAEPVGQLRIIGGRWRRRRLPVVSVPGLRPTPDRVRETLFNWLQPVLPEARCLDLFAGTGALGLEAASRGARQVVLVERDPRAVAALHRAVADLAADRLRIVADDVRRWLSGPGSPFDIVFSDPPYGAGLTQPTCAALVAGGWLAPDARIYLETESGGPEPATPPDWQLVRETTAGEVRARLYRVRPSG